jgi:hypothetical protein
VRQLQEANCILVHDNVRRGVSLSTVAQAQTNPFTKAQVGERIRKVEDGVDQFQKYLENPGQDAKNRADSAQSSGATTRRQRSDSANTDARTNQGKQTKDDHENAMDDLNRTTNRLRRKFDPTSNYLETRHKWSRSWTAHAASIR